MRFRSFNKYNAKRVNGFGSRLENAVYELLKLREKNGEISEIKCQQKVVLQDGPSDVRIAWNVDFSFIKGGRLWYAEAKGVECGEYKLKLKLFRFKKIAPLEIWKGTWQRPYLAEVIE